MIRTILAIDDSATMRALLQATLAQAGYDVTVAPDGEAGFDLAVARQYDLVLTDQNMPRKSGLEVIASLRLLGAYVNTPILVLTTEGSDAFKDAARDAGATGWIEKPIDPAVLVDLVATLSEPAAS
ncbi:response regulator [Burkholderia aenigmatica]|uniref:response regulator n=1 Tax=Burkholderia aenigmatica TaxID=2015348 RepID=UPI002650DF85|nr:response regulator [Burkholderia aenigmatica]MDN7881168.1 response regulator [Burkholderia aenigmatica]